MKKTRHLVMPLLLALLFSCGWESFSDTDEPKDLPKEEPKGDPEKTKPPEKEEPKEKPKHQPTDSLQGKRICVKLSRNRHSIISPQLGDYKVSMEINGGSVYKPTLVGNEYSVRAHYWVPTHLFTLITSIGVTTNVSRHSGEGRTETTRRALYRAGQSRGHL